MPNGLCSECFGDTFMFRRFDSRNELQNGKCSVCDFAGSVVPDNVVFPYLSALYEAYQDDDESDAFDYVVVLYGEMQHMIGGPNKAAIQSQSADIQAKLSKAYDYYDRIGLNPSRNVRPMLPESVWQSYTNELKIRNRYFQQNNFFSTLTDADSTIIPSMFEQALLSQEKIQGSFYRARVSENGLPLPRENMGAPPPHLAHAGRANPHGIPYLYLADSTDTAICEVRPHPGDIVYVSKVKLQQKVKNMLDLSDKNRIILSPFTSFDDGGGDTIGAYVRANASLRRIAHELSRPVNPRQRDIENLPTQVFCEYVKYLGFDGICFSSAVSDGTNVVLFNVDNVVIDDPKRYKVGDVSYAYSPLP